MINIKEKWLGLGWDWEGDKGLREKKKEQT